MPLSRLRSVVLPAPLGPMILTISPSFTRTLALLMATMPKKFFFRFSATRRLPISGHTHAGITRILLPKTAPGSGIGQSEIEMADQIVRRQFGARAFEHDLT